MTIETEAGRRVGRVSSAQPRRVQLSRAKGWRMPENTVKVSRPGKFGNPFVVGEHGSADECVRLYRAWLTPWDISYAAAKLRGKNLACWCRLDEPCHADVLLDLANAQAQARFCREENSNE